MKRLMLLMQTILQECGIRCGISTDLDWKTIEKRVEHEGLEFLTLTLPDFCVSFEEALERGQAVSTDWKGFQIRGTTPVFLGQFLDLVFDRKSGRLVEDVLWDDIANIQKSGRVESGSFFYPWTHFVNGSEDRLAMRKSMRQAELDAEEAIACIRQVTRLFSKLEIEAAEHRVEKAFNDFLDCEKELEAYLQKGWEQPASEFDSIESVGRLLYGPVFYKLSKRATRFLSDTEARAWINR